MIERVLVANRGEIALRVFRTCRRLGIATAAVFSDPDADSLFVAEADLAVPLGGSTPAESYLRGDAIVAAALRCGADAVHPGYGFLSENSAFAAAVADAGLTWIGPSPEAIAAMGSKTEARDRMERAGVPVLPGATIDGRSEAEVAAVAERIGFPLLVKATAGGGGRGMRVVGRADERAGAIESAQREAASAFGDGTVFLERYATEVRHVEIQILGDRHGNLFSLHERDCSVQRRHQKVIEESPSPAVDASLRAEMGRAAVAAGRELAYVGAGTVEFLLDGAGRFFFLEVNTRLQVEHPVTELVTGLDLVEQQIRVAEGHPIDPGTIADEPEGHAIEARVYAEDPANEFLPASGRLERFRFPSGVRIDSGVGDGSDVSPFYDPMLAKVIAHGRNRDDAARKLAAALAGAELHGVTTNRDFLVRVLRHPTFATGMATTAFLETAEAAELARPLLDGREAMLAAAAAALGQQARRRDQARVLATLPSGWRNNPSAPQEARFAAATGEQVVVLYALGRDGELSSLEVDGEPIEGAVLRSASAEEVRLEVDGVVRRYRIGASAVNTDGGQVSLSPLPRLPEPDESGPPGSLLAPMPGAVIRVEAIAGTSVEEGQGILVLEAMKMEHEIAAPTAGTLSELRVKVGDQVEAGDVLAVVDTPDSASR